MSVQVVSRQSVCTFVIVYRPQTPSTKHTVVSSPHFSIDIRQKCLPIGQFYNVCSPVCRLLDFNFTCIQHPVLSDQVAVATAPTLSVGSDARSYLTASLSANIASSIINMGCRHFIISVFTEYLHVFLKSVVGFFYLLKPAPLSVKFLVHVVTDI